MVTGGAAGPIKAFRAKQRLATVTTRKKLAEDTADLVNIRATGHGWYLASDAGCGGQGDSRPTHPTGTAKESTRSLDWNADRSRGSNHLHATIG